MGTPRHTALLYRNEQLFTESASAFVKPGPDKDTTVLAIVTEKHRQDLSEVLANKGQRNEKLIFVDATDCLTQFMVEGWPDQPLFMHTMGCPYRSRFSTGACSSPWRDGGGSLQ